MIDLVVITIKRLAMHIINIIITVIAYYFGLLLDNRLMAGFLEQPKKIHLVSTFCQVLSSNCCFWLDNPQLDSIQPGYIDRMSSLLIDIIPM